MKKQKEITYSYINKYVTDNFIISGDIEVMLENFSLLDDMFKEYNYDITNKCIVKLIESNTKYLHVVEFIFNKYREQIVSGNSSQVIKSNSLELSIDCYCLLNHIDIKHSSDYDLSDLIFYGDLKYYLLEIKQIPLLTVSEERELLDLISKKRKELEFNKKRLKKIIDNNELDTYNELKDSIIPRLEEEYNQLRNRMIDHNYRLSAYVAMKYQNKGLSLEDLIQAGNEGLMRAVEKFRPEKGYKFSSYAYVSIKNNIIRAIQDDGRTIRIPNHMHPVIGRYRKVVRDLSIELGRSPSSLEIAEKMNISLAEVDLLCTSSMEIGSLNALVNQDETDEIGDYIAAPEDNQLDNPFAFSSLDYNKLFASLTARERKIIELRYGFYGKEPMTLDAVGQIFNIKRERVRQIQLKAEKKMSLSREIESFEEYMSDPKMAHEYLMHYRDKNKPNKRKVNTTYKKNTRDVSNTDYNFTTQEVEAYVDNNANFNVEFSRESIDIMKELSKLCKSNQINSTEYVVVSMLLGLSDGKFLTISEIAKYLGMSEFDIINIIENIHEKLKSADNDIVSLIDDNYVLIKRR